ncbi:MAG: hypothetical protein P4L57_10020 [Rhizomicrobium sp.]|nr:hypothetical protein [Rhizomicrobium sp.]
MRKSNLVAGSTNTGVKAFRTALFGSSAFSAVLFCGFLVVPHSAAAAPLTVIQNGGNGSNGHGCCGGNDGDPGDPGTAISASNSDWIHAESNGGNGGAGQGTFGGDGGHGGSGGTIDLTTTGSITLTGVNSAGIYASSNGGKGGHGGDSAAFASVGDGGAGGTGNTITINNMATINALQNNSSGIVALSLGGSGGDGGSCGTGCFGGGGGGPTGTGGTINITSSGDITTLGASNSFGIFAQSVGGAGGAGGSNNFLGLAGWAADSTSGGDGGSVTVNTTAGKISTKGVGSSAIYAQSIGGGGGAGGTGVGLFYGGGGAGTAGGSGNAVQVINYATLTVTGNQSDGIYAQSIGGGGGAGGTGGSLFASFGGSGGAGQNGGMVDVQNHGAITVSGNADFNNISSSTLAAGIFAQSIGGGGGDGGAALVGLANFGGTGGAAGTGNTVTVTNDATIKALCGAACVGGQAIFAQSVGGGGGNGGGALGVVSFGGAGGGGGDGGVVTVTNNGGLTTTAQFSAALFAQSVGGGGGNGNFAGGIASFGGSGGEGGTGHAVTVNNGNAISTSGADSDGIFAQSVGGGGGNGGGAVGVGVFVSFAMGGGGGSGGDGGTVCVNTNNGSCSNPLANASALIQTSGDRSTGILAQSVGGGGGNGGFAISASVGLYGNVSIGLGGMGAMGGHGGDVFVGGGGTIITGSQASSGPNAGQFSDGIDAESIGGGGGNGGFSVAVGASTGASLSVGLGGNGGAGNYAGAVTVNTQDSVTTYGDQAIGIFARSIGGGGGNGGFAFAGAGSPYASVGLAFGGGGGDGAYAGAVKLDNAGTITTFGALSNGITAQSIGGGGGNGGFSVSAAVTISGSSGSAALSFGGDGGSGGYGGTVHASNTGAINTNGVGADGILAQSIGGGGGNGGFSGALTVSGGAAFSDAIGGGGGGGNHAGAVDVTNTGSIRTMSDNATGITAQSIGGGGGNGGFSLSVSATLNSMAIGKATGGSSGDGGYGDTVSVLSNGTIWTSGNLAYGILAQSIGGGGGNGGFSIAGAFSESGSATGSSVGGNGGNGNYASAVTVTTNPTNTSSKPGTVIYTTGLGSIGILAQSIGGGGGNGGFAADINASIEDGAGDNSLGATGAVGGGGGLASNGGTVTVNNNGKVVTTANAAHGIVAQSIGGGGGNGAFAISGSFSLESDASSNAVGGKGGTGGKGSKVTINNKGDVQISGDLANGLVAQSIGGGGGNGGFSISGALSLGGKAASNSVGGSGGNGGIGDEVDVYNSNAITIGGAHSVGIVAQSVGGGGGNGGFAIGLGVSINGSDGVSDTTGGTGGGGGKGGVVNVYNYAGASIITQNAMDFGILAQSIGGGGGNGGFTVSGAFSSSGDAKTTVGGGCNADCTSSATGGGGGDSMAVLVDNAGFIATNGALSVGVVAQSIGGGGGTGGWAGALSLSTGGDSASTAIGGSGGAGGVGGQVTVTNEAGGVVHTFGASSVGILAQSIGGGGGSGGFAGSLSVSTGGDASNNVGGGAGGGGGNSGLVTVQNAGLIQTEKDNSTGILAQSIGGGGGNGGFSIAGSGGTGDGSANNVGGAAAAGGNGGVVHVINSGQIVGNGALSYGILAQSIGGGGGNGGFSVEGTLASGSGGDSQSVGGSGGAGGTGGSVQVDNTGSIILKKAGSVGVFAQSIGGGGGTGGFNAALNISGGSVGQTIGGTGGSGGDGGNVVVNSTGNITTSGDNSIGVLAQSIGGGGGYGGINVSIATGDSNGTSLNIGSRASGGSKGTVTVNVTGNTTVKTTGALSDGLLAQGIGGGGGFGGLAVDDPLVLGPAGAMLFLGATGAGGGDGTATTPTNSNNLITTGAGALAAVAQSIGGGGGQAGQSGDYDLGSNVLTLSATLGGNSTSGGNGAAAILTNTGNITTGGSNALALLSQSIGGGGGVASFSFGTLTGSPLGVVEQLGGAETLGGNGALARVTTLGNTSTTGVLGTALLVQSIGGGGGFGSLAVTSGIPVGGHGFVAALGATKGAGGTGAVADAEVLSGSLLTTGHAAPAIVAQSIGGGGGFAANFGVNNAAIVNLGASGGAGGDAGQVTVNSAAVIATTGTDSHAIVAQSIGGGGGLFLGVDSSGNPIATRVEPMSGGAGGSGAAVVVNNTAVISTTGIGAAGIIAQSIGGGGGLVGGGQFAVSIPVGGAFAGTVGGTGFGATVAVTTTANVLTTGKDATAILVQSQGGSGQSDMRVTVASGVTVAGGTGLGHAVSMYGGLRNILSNSGRLLTQPLLALEPQNPLLGQSAAQNAVLNVGIEEFVITGTFGSDTVNNAGQIYGNVNLQQFGPYTDVNPFNNAINAYFAPGNTVILGDAANSGNRLTNAGTVSPGDFYNVLTTALTGNFTQTSTGTDLTDLDLNPNTADRINLSGAAALSGTVMLSFNNPGWAKPGSYDLTIVAAAGGRGGTTFTTLSSAPSAVFTPTLTYPNANNADLSYTIDFSPSGLSGNQHSLGYAVNGIQTAGVPAFRIIAAELFFIPTVPLLGKTYDSLDGEGVSGIEQSIFYSRHQFFNAAMMNASAAIGAGSGPFALTTGGSAPGSKDRFRFWMSGWGGSGYAGPRANAGSAKDDYGSAGGSAGVEYMINDKALIGFTAGAEQANFNVPARQTKGHGVGYNLGLYGMVLFEDNIYASGVLSYGHYSNREMRANVGVGLDATHPWTYINQPLTPIPVENTMGKFHSQMFGGQLEVGWKHVFADGNLTPYLNVQFDNQWQSKFDEAAFVTSTGAAGILGLHYDAMSVPSVPVTLGVQGDTSVDVGGGMTLMPVLRLGWRHEFETLRPVQAGFLIAPGFDFKTQGAEAPRDALEADAALVFNVSDNVVIYTNFAGAFSHSGTEMSGTGGLKLRF